MISTKTQSMKNKTIFIIIFICAGWLNVGCQNNHQDTDSGEKAEAEASGYSIQFTNLGPTFFSQDDFYYDVDARFQADITKSRLKEMKLITDFDERIDVENILEVRNTSVTIINDDYENVEQAHGNSNELTAEQIRLIESAPYSTDIRLRMDYIEKSPYYDTPQHNYTTPHITIVPEESAEYEGGKEGLIQYLKRNSREEVMRNPQGNLKPGKVRFTISMEGKVKDVLLISTCGYDTIDETMLKLVKELPGKWKPAKNEAGQIIEEQLVFYFGTMGC